MAIFNINNQNFNGNNLTIHKVFIDGKEIATIQGNVTIVVTGDVNQLKSGSADVEINGDSYDTSTGSGDIIVKGNVKGNIKTGSGDVTIDGNHTGNITTGSGDVTIN